MARHCEICNKGILRGHKISKSGNKTLRRWNPNLQKVRVRKGGGTTTIRVCTRCIRAGKVVKAV